MRALRFKALLAVGIIILLLGVAMVETARGACLRTEPESYNPTGWEGCAAYGTGMASRWDGPGIAVNSCVYPWTDCEPIRVTSLETGRALTVTPSMFCDCYHGTRRERLVDLDPAAVRRLGLSWAQGLYPVRVEPVELLPDTAT